MMASFLFPEAAQTTFAVVFALLFLAIAFRQWEDRSKTSERKRAALEDPEQYRRLCQFEDDEKARKQQRAETLGSNAVKATLFGLNLFKKR